jgi:hypothetical protein
VSIVTALSPLCALQMMQVFPSFFVISDASVIGNDRQHRFAPGMATYVWAAVFVIEHLLFLFAGSVNAVIPDIPDWYQILPIFNKIYNFSF